MTSKPVAIGLIWFEDTLVVGRRAPGTPLAGYHEFPGGKCEPGETPEQTVVRECQEEAGLSVVVTGLRMRNTFHYEHGIIDLHFFDCVLLQPADQPPPLPSPFQWIPRTQVLELPFPPGNDQVLETLRNGRGERPA